MQALDAKVHDTGTGARPASGSALLAGQLVIVTVPLLTMSNDLLAIGDEWTELCASPENDTVRSASMTNVIAGPREPSGPTRNRPAP